MHRVSIWVKTFADCMKGVQAVPVLINQQHSKLLLLALDLHACKQTTDEETGACIRKNAMCCRRTSEKNVAWDSVPRIPELVVEEA